MLDDGDVFSDAAVRLHMPLIHRPHIFEIKHLVIQQFLVLVTPLLPLILLLLIIFPLQILQPSLMLKQLPQQLNLVRVPLRECQQLRAGDVIEFALVFAPTIFYFINLS